jgi:hypothetical protein
MNAEDGSCRYRLRERTPDTMSLAARNRLLPEMDDDGGRMSAFQNRQGRHREVRAVYSATLSEPHKCTLAKDKNESQSRSSVLAFLAMGFVDAIGPFMSLAKKESFSDQRYRDSAGKKQ